MIFGWSVAFGILTFCIIKVIKTTQDDNTEMGL